MPAPRGEDPARNGDNWTRRNVIHAALPVSGRDATGAEAQRRHRAGIRVGRNRSGRELIWSGPARNGMPESRPYTYRGTGADAFTGEVVR